MDTFHIEPTHPLAAEAAKLVAKFGDEEFIAIRGTTFRGEDTFYILSACPSESTTGYLWTYVRAGDWMKEYNAFGQQGE